MFKAGDVCKMCGQKVRPNKHKSVITNERLAASKDGWTVEVMVCTDWWNHHILCEKCVIKVITKGRPDSGIMEHRKDKIVRLNSMKYELKERDFEV